MIPVPSNTQVSLAAGVTDMLHVLDDCSTHAYTH